jgi:cytoskeletal protein RodZ
MFEIGSSLREARHRRKIEMAQAEQATKIRGKYLRALEDEQFALLPAETYVKGFLRTYAEYLGLDGQLYVDEYDSRFVAGRETSQRPRRSRPRRSRRLETIVVVAVLAAIAILTVVVIGAWSSSDHGATGGTGRTQHRSAKVTHAIVPGLAIHAVRGSSYVAVRRRNAAGRIVFQGTVARGHTIPFRGSRFWIAISTPEHLVIKVRGHTIHVGGRRPRVITVTPTAWNVD